MRSGDQDAFPFCFFTLPFHFLAARAAHPEVRDRSQGIRDRRGLDQNDHKRPSVIAQPDDPFAAVDDLHPGMSAVEVDAALEVGDG